MTTVKVDLGPLRKVQRMAKRQMASHARVMLGFAQRGADTLVNSDKYNNRTGLLRTNTMARVVEDSPNKKVVFLAMLREYASYVRGHGLTNIDQVAKRVQDGIQRRFERDAKKISDA